MNGSRAVWVNAVSAMVLVAVLALFLSEITGEFFAALAGAVDNSRIEHIRILGRAFGAFFFSLLGVGGILIPGELLGFIRFHGISARSSHDQRELARTILLATVAILSIASVVALALVVAKV